MKKWISGIVSALVGVGLAVTAAYAVVSTNTAAPSHNPAGDPKQQVVDYGQK